MTQALLELAASPEPPVLHLSGERLRCAFAALVKAAEPIGGVERFAAAARLKGEIIVGRLAAGGARGIDRAAFAEVVRLMPTVRRRIGPLIAELGWARLGTALADLLTDAHVPGTADRRMAAFERALVSASPGSQREAGRARFVRDLAAEVLHAALPEHYPLMTRWVWDAKVNTGVLREVWHDPVAGTAVDGLIIDVPDTHATFLALRAELSQFLAGQGIFRDMLWYVDLIKAQVYGDYINAQGGAYLKTDFATEADPLEHTRRILGLDVRPKATGSRR